MNLQNFELKMMSLFRSHKNQFESLNDNVIFNTPLLIDNKIWYLVTSYYDVQDESNHNTKWIMYDIGQRTHSLGPRYPYDLSPEIGDWIACNKNIYLFGVQGNWSHNKMDPVVFNTKTKNHSMEFLNNEHFTWPNFGNAFMIRDDENNIMLYATNHDHEAYYRNYNISKQQFGEAIYCKKKIEYILYDNKTKQHIIITTKRIEYRYILKFEPLSNKHAISGIRFKLHYNILIGYRRMMIYDNYFISFNPSTYESTQETNKCDHGHIFVADLITANAAMLINLRCIGGYPVIANDLIGMTQCLIKYYIKKLQNHKSLFIPIDIELVIVEFMGNYYDKTIHLFNEIVSNEYHKSICLGIIINQYIQEQGGREKNEKNCRKYMTV